MLVGRRRLFYFAGLVALCFVALEVRLFHLQVLGHPAAAETVARMHQRTESLLAARGRILDRKGIVLAESIPAVDVYADARWTEGRRPELAERLKEALGDPHLDVLSRLGADGYKRIMRRPLADGDRIAALWRMKREGRLPGIDLNPTWIRRYPEGALGACVIGFVDTEGIGRAGLEMRHDGELLGTPGRRVMKRDAGLRPLLDADCEWTEPVTGCDVELTLDTVVQYFVEDALDDVVADCAPEWAAIVVLDPRNGEVLALGSRPGYDPNHYGNYPLGHHVNRAVSYNYTPGSTFKPFVMAAALERGVVRLDERIDCSAFDCQGRRVHDVHTHVEPLTPAEIVIHSSNIGMASIALRLVPGDAAPRSAQVQGFVRLRRTLVDLGFGRRTGIGLPSEEAGNLRSVQHWSRKYTLVSMAFGHEVQVTALQTAAAFAALANGGVAIEPTLVKELSGAEGASCPSPAARGARRVFEPETAAAVKEMMVRVVDEGTGRRARIDGYAVAGKTSTAEYETDTTKHTSSFAGFAPASDPRLVVVVVVDQPKGKKWGGEVAAPAAREILQRGLAYLQIPPDRVQSR